MINFSLNTCWRLIPTKGDKGAFSFAAFSFLPSQVPENKGNATSVSNSLLFDNSPNTCRNHSSRRSLPANKIVYRQQTASNPATNNSLNKFLS